MAYILAQYTIRSKQEYIFRSNRMIEIIGASENISKSWDILFEQAQKAGKKVRGLADGIEFDKNEIQKAFEDHALHMVELFRGGGNDTVLFDCQESFREVNKAFSYYLLKNYPGMIPMAVCCEYTGNYLQDYANLMQEADREKNRMISGQSSFILPFSMMERNSFQPYSRVMEYGGGQFRVTEEEYAKRKQGREISQRDPRVKILDDIITGKEEESLLAVIHADGNNMGVKIAGMLGNNTDYNICISKMRVFTADTANAFIAEGRQAMEECQKELRKKFEGRFKDRAFLYRMIIADGDDMTFVCNARFAMEYAKAYLKYVQEYQSRNQSNWRYSSCAGICIFHSHYPFARAYSMAEQACDSAKEKVHVSIGEPIEEGWIDFHYIHSGIGGNLESVREQQGTSRCMARPWQVAGDGNKGGCHYDRLQELARLLHEYHVSRSDIKTISSEFESSFSSGEKELIRIYGHHKGLRNRLEEKYTDKKQLLGALYDLAEMYDLWFMEGK